MRPTLRRALPLALLLVLPLTTCSSGKTKPYPTPAASVPLGVAYDAGTQVATFRVWAPAARSVDVLFLGSPAATHPLARDLTGGGSVDEAGWNGVWQATLAGVPQGQLYQYRIGGSTALDPYAPSMTLFNSRSGPDSAAAAVLDPAAQRPFDPATGQDQDMIPFDRPAGYQRREDAIVYEVHVRDFTILLPPGSLRHPPGTYRAFTEKLDHVRDLGATHVQLLPVLAWYDGNEDDRAPDRTSATQGSNYNWGYDPHNYWAPDGMFSADPRDPVLRVKELKTLVNEAHKRGLGVILDVVYNHTTATLGTSLLDALAPGYYYRGRSVSGAGPDVASERTMARRLIVDSIVHWVRDYGVDGFRFDLMGLMDSVTIERARAAAAAVKPDVLFVGEGWTITPGNGVPGRDDEGNGIVPATQQWMTSTDSAAVFSDSFRDAVKGGGLNETSDTDRGFLTGASSSLDKGALLRNLRGDPTNFDASVPGDVVQYLTAHDGLTLHDKIAKILALSPDTQRAEILGISRLGFVLLATAQGIAFVHGGCEMGRTKRVGGAGGGAPPEATSGNVPGVYYVFNSYDSSDAVNGYDWASWMAPGSPGEGLYRYASGLFALRRSSDAFRLASKATAATHVTPLDLGQADAIGYRVASATGPEAFHVFVNAGTGAATLSTGGADLRLATVLVDDDEAGTTAVTSPSGFTRGANSITLQPRTAVILRTP
jgi:secreted pullulanase